ncbi:MAG: DUF2000 domain-containing protein [Oscillospiraceae bacterium]|nr:DUF2000 domain-containing protein [Oscillospiraceae bacterium]
MNKGVMIIDGEQPAGVCCNIAAVLGASLGKLLPEAVGADTVDRDGNIHRGIIEIPIPILKGELELLRNIISALSCPEYRDIVYVDFTELAQSCRTYPEYEEKIARTPEAELRYLGLALYGEKRLVSSITGNLPLLR